MKISTKGRYGLRAMLELALHYGEGPILVETISRHQGISGKYIHNLMCNLTSARLVRGVRGPKGGYALSRDPAGITVRDILDLLEGRVAPVHCVGNKDACPRSDRCAARDVWTELAEAMEGVLSGITLAALAARQREKQLPCPMYHI